MQTVVTSCELECFRFAVRAQYSPSEVWKRVLPMSTERISLELVEFGTPPSGILRRLFVTLARWRERDSQRAALAQLPPYMLRDLGLTEADVWRETRLPPWLLY